jgi:hypothetical protein
LFDIKEIGENSKKLAKLVEFTLEKSLISKNFPILLEKKMIPKKKIQKKNLDLTHQLASSSQKY